ncbi:hypothetical protein CL652_02550 [bacterium]|nr:hypothetical protein [bacterium]|tara:strand:- start:11939 stop:12520 length:582 start_codon:yes stop_codon:yes gene_type:complete
MARKTVKATEKTRASKRDTVKERQERDKKKFIDKLEESPIIQVVAAKVGVDRSTYYRWRNEDAEFREACEAAREKGIEFVNDMMESILIKNAKADKLTAVIFWLKNHSVQYSDKLYHRHKHEFDDNPLTPERIEEIARVGMAWHDVEEDDFVFEEEEELEDVEEDDAVPDEDVEEPVSKKGVAKMYTPKRSSK